MSTNKKYVSFDKLGLYDEKIKKVITDADAAALQTAQDYADSLAVNYDAAGSAASAQAAAIAHADAEVAKANAAAAAAQKAADDAAAAATTADGKAVKAQEEVDALETVVAELDAYVGDIPTGYTETNVIAYINKKAEETLNAASGGSSESAASVLQALNTYKAENDPKVAANTTAAANAQTAADQAQSDVNALAQTHATDKAALEAKDTELAAAIAAEKERAEGIEGGFKTRIETMEAFWSAAQADGTDSNVIDTLKEIQEYIASDETGASQMAASIKQNADDIDAVEGRMQVAEDKLATVAEGAQVNVIETVKVNGVALSVADKAVDVTIPTGALAGKDVVSESDLEATLATKLNGMIDAAELESAMNGEVTRVDALLDKKVDKVEGKGLSTNDLTNELKANYDAAYTHSQAAHAPVDAQANVIESVKVNGTALTITGKAVDITVPTDNSSLTNGAGYLVAADIANKADKSTTLAGYGITNAYTKSETDTAISNAMATFVEVSEEDINSLFA